MDDDVFTRFLSSDINDVFKNSKTFSFCLSNEQPRMEFIETRMETVTEANDVLKNGILIETSKGVEWLSLTDALTSGVGGLNLSVEDFQNVAAQLLSNSHTLTNPAVLGTACVCERLDPAMAGAGPSGYVCRDLASSFCITTKDDCSVVEMTVNAFKKLESIAELCESVIEVDDQKIKSNGIVIEQHFIDDEKAKCDANVLSESSSLVGVSESTNSDSSIQSTIPSQVKKKGGWPKGRKRKQELLENRPPKAPSTGYVLYLNEKRKLFKDMPFPEVTKLLGNEWSKLSLEEKREYLERAELDKKRYREELRVYRKSEAYQSYLRRKRIKSLQANGTEESDVDATDELDDEDNEELYCRACDQWFTTLHNKKEHLYGRQHFQSISLLDQHSNREGTSHSLDESSLDGLPAIKGSQLYDGSCVTDSITNVFQASAARENEIRFLKRRLGKTLEERNKMVLKIQELQQTESSLKLSLLRSKEEEDKIEQNICSLWEVPSLFIKCQDLESQQHLVIE